MAFRVLLALPELALRGMPRLVRLNPNVPWKTRGNGAVVLDLVKPTGPQVRVGELQGKEVLAFPDGAPVSASQEWLERIWNTIQAHAEPEADPGLALFDARPSPLHYWAGVREILDIEPALPLAKGGRARIGCQAAAAWPGPATSYEFIAYREEARWRTPRDIAEAPFMNLDSYGLFHTSDPEENLLCCVPNTPCPVLLGLRGTNPDALQRMATQALLLGAKEPVDGWLLFATNQASGDHVTEVPTLLEADPGMTLRLEATCVARPIWKEGGHVHVEMEDAFGIGFAAVAFEPTKSFRHDVDQMRPGDKLELVGAWDKALRLESFHIVSAPRFAAPVCCEKNMKSRGTGAGFKCSKCGAKEEGERSEWSGSFEVPVMARRHLHRPLTWPRNVLPSA